VSGWGTPQHHTCPLRRRACAFAEFERALILERQREGIAAAKQRGAYTGRKPALTPEQAGQLRERAAGERKSALAKEFGISRETVYTYLRTASAADVTG
jgi:DNA invertase Pin-like site-specific DNA recombinase